MRELLKLVVQPVIALREDGKVIREDLGPQVALYTEKQIVEFVRGVEAELEQLNAEPEPEATA